MAQKRASASCAIVKVNNFLAIPEVLGELGAETERILYRAGLNRTLFSDPDNAIAFRALGRLTNECVKVTACEEFGLRTGIKMGASSIGLAGFALLNARTVRDALRVLVGALKLTVTGIHIFFEDHNESAALSFAVTERDIAASDQILDAAIAVSCNIMRELLGSDWCPRKVLLARQRPGNCLPFLTFFQAPVLFNAVVASLIFNAKDLELPIAARNAELYAFLSRLLDKALVGTRSSFSSEVRNLLMNQVSSGPLTKSRAASALGMAQRSFARRLADEGVSFSELADQTKRETAQHLLSQEISITDAALHLGYSDVSAFNRAFKHWTGMAPSRWRAGEQSEPVAADPDTHFSRGQ